MTSAARFNALVFAVACVWGTGIPLLGEASSSAIDAELGCQMRNGQMSLRITLHNRDSADTAVVFGSILANGGKYLADNLALDVRAGSDLTRYQYFDPSVPGIAGRVDAWIVSLPAESEYTLVRSLSHFWSGSGQLSTMTRPFATRLAFVAPPTPSHYAIPAFKVYQGQLISSWVEVPTQCVAG
jgi:hypothetical protein